MSRRRLLPVTAAWLRQSLSPVIFVQLDWHC